MEMGNLLSAYLSTSILVYMVRETPYMTHPVIMGIFIIPLVALVTYTGLIEKSKTDYKLGAVTSGILLFIGSITLASILIKFDIIVLYYAVSFLFAAGYLFHVASGP